MKITFGSSLGEGVFSNVWRGQDSLDRSVAIKIIRPGMAGMSDAISHAKALARAEHENIVKVYGVETLDDPETGNPCDAIIMELLDGETLADYLKGAAMSIQDLHRIGRCLISGVQHMHQQGLVHGDLHAENVMVGESYCKIIDILYFDTLAFGSTASKEARISQDLKQLRFLLQDSIASSDLDAAEAVAFNTNLDSSSSLEDIRTSFLRVTDATTSQDVNRRAEHAYQRLVDSAFVEGVDYAVALSDATDNDVVPIVLSRVVKDGAIREEHRQYLRLLWNRITASQKEKFVFDLEQSLEKELPDGNWVSHLRMLGTLSQDGWKLLSKIGALRIQKIVANDILSGRKDLYERKVFAAGGGIIGTYIRSLWPSMSNLETVSENLKSMLRQNWYTQNYIGGNFMSLLSPIAEDVNDTEGMLAALICAVENDARIVIANLHKLPVEWQVRIKSEADVD